MSKLDTFADEESGGLLIVKAILELGDNGIVKILESIGCFSTGVIDAIISNDIWHFQSN